MKVIKIPLNAGGLSKKDGMELGPDKICEFVPNYYLKESGLLPFITTEELKVNNSNIEESSKIITEFTSKLDVPAIFLGGDHSLTYSTFKAFSKNHKNPGLLVFDAHLDCENNFSPPSHEDYLRVLIEEGHLDKNNVVLVGIRNMHTNELEYLKKKKLKVFDACEIIREGIHDTTDAVMAAVRPFDALYVSIDIDVLDPVFAPGTGYIEPGGLSSRELIYFIQRLKNLKNIRMWDLVEVNPKKDVNNLTVSVAAKLVVEMC
jgi:arginase family enzyme